MSVNKVTILGNLGKDVEIKSLPSGALVANMTIATNESYTKTDGTKVDAVEWHNVVLWGNLAKVAEQYLKKGSPVYIEGKLFTESWEQEGKKQYSTKIKCTSLQLLSSKGHTIDEETEEANKNMPSGE